MYFDLGYIIMLLPALALSFWASARVKSSFRKYSEQYSRRGLSAAQAARDVLAANGLSHVSVERVAGELTDHYDPTANVIRLSQAVYDSSSTAAIGVACHEVGHAIQYARNYAPAKLRTAIIPATNLGARLSTPLIIAGFLLASFSEALFMLVYLGIILFALSTLVQLITLPVEFNASRRAMESISQRGILYEDEMEGVRSVLGAAALTYVAALAVSAVQLLRLVLMARRRD